MKALSLALGAMLVGATGASSQAHDMHHHETFAAGVPGDPAAPAETIDLTIHDKDGKMSFGVGDLDVKQGEQVRFVVDNDDRIPHELRLDSKAGNVAHAAMMQQMPGMTHHDPNATTVPPGKTATLVWRFSKTGTFEYACLIPGHYQAGMHGTITVAK